MRKLKLGLCLPAAAIAMLALPATAGAEYLVPPGNSAATQYTETVPTAGGQRDTENDGRKGDRSPADVLGDEEARKLQGRGEDGEEVASFSAETAPAEEGTSATRDEGDGADGESAGGPAAGPGGPSAPNGSIVAASSDGSSGLGEVIAEATGWSSSQGLLLLAILGAIAWGLAFLWRQRDRSTV